MFSLVLSLLLGQSAIPPSAWLSRESSSNHFCATMHKCLIRGSKSTPKTPESWVGEYLLWMGESPIGILPPGKILALPQLTAHCLFGKKFARVNLKACRNNRGQTLLRRIWARLASLYAFPSAPSSASCPSNQSNPKKHFSTE